MSKPGKKIHLVGHMCTGPTNHHMGSWRHPESDAHRVYDIDRYQDLARLYEKGLFDGVFIVDLNVLPDLTPTSRSEIVEHGGILYQLDPMQVLVAMAGVTKHLGLAATMSTSLHKPYYIARSFATLDHLSKGRAGWNIVTSGFDQEARSFGLDGLPDKETRYDIADETVEACIELWNSWEPDALKFDREKGQFADSSKVHFARYQGKRVKTEGALTVPYSPQGRPVFMQAGASDRGLQFASRWAELIFTHQQARPLMQDFYAQVKAQVAAAGRKPGSCLILPSIEVIAAETMAEAEERVDYLDSLAMPQISVSLIGRLVGRDLSQVPLDTPLTEIEPGEKGPNIAGMYNNMMAIRNKDGRGLTLGEAAILQATTWWSPRLVGTAETIADSLQEMVETDCCDGFIITQALSPGGLESFVDLVVPELQRRGVYRTEYTGRTFRENLAD